MLGFQPSDEGPIPSTRFIFYNMSKSKVLNFLTDIDILRSHILPLQRSVFLKKSKEKYLKTQVPLSYWKDFKYIARCYDVRLIADNTVPTGYGAYSEDEYRIFLGVSNEEGYSEKDLFKAFFHELAHRIQQAIYERLNLEDIETRKKRVYNYMIKYERTAERLSYFLCKIK